MNSQRGAKTKTNRTAAFVTTALLFVSDVYGIDPATLKQQAFSISPNGHELIVKPLDDGGWQVSTTGDDPYVGTQGFVEAYDRNKAYVIAFEYQAPADFGNIVFYYRTPAEVRHTNARMRPADEWTWHFFDFTVDGKPLNEELRSFRIDFGERKGLSFKIRNCRLIEATPDLRRRAAIGEKADDLDSFGITLHSI